MQAKFIRGNRLRLTLYKHDKPGLALKKFPPFSVIREMVKSLSPGGGGRSSGQIVLPSSCRGVRAEMRKKKKSGVMRSMTSREEVKWVEGASSLSESQIKRELKIYVSRFVLDSGAPLVGVISTAAFLLKWAWRNSRGESCCCCFWGPHSDGGMRSRKKWSWRWRLVSCNRVIWHNATH